jgi:hypothetical protein
MGKNLLREMGWYGLALLLIVALLAPDGAAQTVTKVKTNISVTESETQCNVEYTIKNGTSELKEIGASTILFQDTKLMNVKASDAGGELNVSGSSSGGKYSSKIVLREPVPPNAAYSFALAYQVEGSVKPRNGTNILTVPLLALPWRSIVPKEPVCSIDATLPPGMNLIRTSPRILSTAKRDSRIVAHTSSSVLVSFFHAEYTAKEVGFFTPENTTNVVFSAAIIVLILIWTYYNFVYMKRETIKGGT